METEGNGKKIPTYENFMDSVKQMKPKWPDQMTLIMNLYKN